MVTYSNSLGMDGSVAAPGLNKIRAALAEAEGINIESISRNDNLANNLKLSYYAVDRNPYQARVEVKARELEKSKNDMFKAWAQYDAPNAALARDDEKLAGLLDVNPLREGLERGLYIVRRSRLANRILAGDESVREELSTLEKEYGDLTVDRSKERARRFYYTGETGRHAFSFLEDTVEQLPIMATTYLPGIETAIEGAAAGGLIGFISGGSTTGPGAAITAPAGALIGGTTGFLAGTYKGSRDLEKGSIAADLLMQVDADGNPLSLETIQWASELYANTAALIETSGAGFLMNLWKSLGFKTLGKDAAKEQLKLFYKNAVLRAAKSRSAKNILLGALKGSVGGAGIEGLEEGSQEAAQVLTEFATKSFAPGYFINNDLLTQENAAQIGEAAYKGFKVGLTLGILPSAIITTVNLSRAKQANEFMNDQVALHKAIEETKTKQFSPERMATFLEKVKGVRGDVYLPADAVQELYQNDVDLITPLGFTPEEVQDLAANGQDLIVPLSEVQSFLNPEEFGAAAEIMRVSPDAYNYAEVSNIKDFEAGQELSLMEAYDEYVKEMGAWEQESGRLRDELSLAINANKNLTAQAVAFGGSVDSYIDTTMELLTNFANRMSVYGQSPSKFLSKINVNALLANGELNPEGMNYEQATAYAAAQEEHPIKTQIKGRLRAASLKEKWPGAYKAIMAAGNGWVFSRKAGEGVAVDELADELTRSGPLASDQSFYADDLVEWLKEPRKQTLYQTENSKQLTTREDGPAIAPDEGAISAINLGVLKGEVKPSRIENGVLFQGGSKKKNGAPRGKLTVYPESYLIGLFPRANLSTLLHEIGHVFYEEFETAVNAAKGQDAQLATDFEALKSWLGVEEGQTKLTVEQKEKFARGFEAYLREGVAPTEELAGAFKSFKKWLLHIYKQVKDLNVELTDEVRGVFDRMLAYDAQVEEAAAMNNIADLTEKDLASLDKLSDSEKNYALKMIALAKEYASEILQRAANNNLTSRIKEYLARAEAAVTNNPFYVATASIIDSGGIDIETARYNFDDATIKAINLKHGKVFTKNGADLEVVAAEHGYSSGKGLVNLFLQMPARQDAIQSLVDADIKKYDAQFSALETLLKQKGVKDQLNLVAEYFSQMLGKKVVDTRAYALLAAHAMASTTMRRAVRGDLYLGAFKRAWGKMRGVLAAGKIATAIKNGNMKSANAEMIRALEANYQAQINYESYLQSLEIAKALTSLRNRIKKFVHQKSANPDARYTVMNLAMNYGLGKYVDEIGRGRDAGTVKSWLNQAQENGYELLLDENLMSGQRAWQDLTVAEFQELENNIVQIMTVERNERKFLQGKQREDLETVCENISEAVRENKDPLPRKTVEKENLLARILGSVHGAHTKIETLCIRMDGGIPSIVHAHIYQPMANARDVENKRFKKVLAELNSKKLFGMYSKRELSTMGGRRYFIESIGESLTKENMLCVALNMGNEANYQRIKEGHGWNDAQINDVVKGLDERDWAFVQAVWDYIETFKDESFDLEQRVTGVRPKGVPAQAFINPLGVAMRGGYYPIEYNVTKSAVAYDKQQKKIEQEIFGTNGGTQAMTAKGHLKARASQGLGVPLDLTLPVITNHVFNVVHDLAFREAVLDVAKIIRNNKFRESVEGTYGPGIYRLFMPWLKDVANERQEPMMCINKWAKWARSGSTLMAMGYKITTMMAQPLGFSQTMAYLGYKYSGAGVKTVFGEMHRLPELWEQTKAMSEFMANRINSYDREIRDMSKMLKPNASYFEVLEIFRKHAFTPMGYFQLAVDLPTWWGAYYKGLDEYGGDDVKAIAFADSAVRITQSGGNVEDLAAIQRGGEIQRLFTMFYSYFSAFYNLSALQFSQIKLDNKPEAILRAANMALLLWFVPSILSELVAGRGPDDDEETWKWFSQNVLSYPFQTVVGVRDIANGIFSEFDYQITPAQGAPASLVKWAKNVYKAIAEGKTDHLLKSSVEALGFVAHLPIKQAVISVGNVWEYINGDDPDFYIRDLFYAKPQSRK